MTAPAVVDHPTGRAGPSAGRSPWQRLYGGAHRLRAGWYRTRAGRLPRPVVSVGNLHWGGSGKTPLVAALAAHLRDRGLAVCVLSRGYGGRGRGVRLVSAGAGPLLGPAVAGDEPVLLAREVPGVTVVVGADRRAAGIAALESLSPAPQIFLLDDGFSHLALHRDLDLLAFPAADPFGGGRLFPGGRLREPLAAVARATAAILTGATREAEAGELALALRPWGFTGPGFASVTRTGPPSQTAGGPLPSGSGVVLVSGVARPAAFRAAAGALGYPILGELCFPDHHRYPPSSLQAIRSLAARSGAEAVLTTAKDQVKLESRLGLPLAVLPVAAAPEPAFWRWLDAAVARLVAR